MAQKPTKKPAASKATGDALVWEDLKGHPWAPTFAGIPSFLKLPVSHDFAGVDVVVSGVPFDNATTDRPGCRFGPRGIRAASGGLSELKAFPFGFELSEHLRVVDFGDCVVNHHLPDTIVPSIEAHAARILAAGPSMLTFGGDHFITYPLLKAHVAKHGPVALLQFDSHCDTWTDWTSETDSLNHGSMFLRAAKEGLIDLEHSVQVGLRTYNDSDHGFEILTSPWMLREGVDATIAAIKKRVGKAKVYLSYDIDFLDPAYAPGTGTPVAGGPATWQALAILRGLASLDIVGMDIVEVSPAYDHAEITSIAAATLAHDYLCLLALKKGAKGKPVGRI
jgi:agmatinase